MYSGDLNIKHIPLKVFYDKTIVQSSDILPSEKRNIDIITGIRFGNLLYFISAKKEKHINSWLRNNKKRLNEYLKGKRNNLVQNELVEHCKHLNYILDFVVQAVNNFDKYKFFKLSHEFDKNSINILNSYESLKCRRELFDLQDKNLYIKKIMYDLFDDIEYMLSVKHFRKSSQCLNMFNRITYRWGILWNIYDTVSDRKIFDFDKNCTLSIIGEKLKALKCNTTPIAAPTVTATELPSSGGDLSESRGSEDEELLDVENPESADTFPENLTISLPVNEDPPKLDTTYAAASLAGISLFGTILYKYTSFGSWLNPRRGARIRGNVFPLGNNVYDASTMNNFEYLQTGIPNGEYQLGYGSITDY